MWQDDERLRSGLGQQVAQALDAASGWRIEFDAPRHWLVVSGPRAKGPEQGWKLHLSATVNSAPELLRCALPVLRDEQVGFKIAASLQQLSELNDGQGGVSQIGKFVTVYPHDDAQAVRLAAALDQVTRGLAGPAVPSDRPLRPGSSVHYRYGSFDGRVVQLSYGEIVAAIARPDGEFVPDRRGIAYAAPDWTVDPFLAAGVAEDVPPRDVMIAGRILLASLLHASPRGTVHLALDIERYRRCVVKGAVRGDAGYGDAQDARDRLRHEFQVLSALASHPQFPIAYELIERDEELFLVMEDVEGPTLAEHISKGRVVGRLPAPDQIIEWGLQLARAIAGLHALGFVHRDIKPTNVIVARSGLLRLVDVELAHDPHSGLRPPGLGTHGYMSPQQAAGRPPVAADDVYGLGATLYFAATGGDPAQAPRARPLDERPPRLLNPMIGYGLEILLERCLEPASDRRLRNIEEVVVALSVARLLAKTGDHDGAAPPWPRAESFAKSARRLGETLVKLALRLPDGSGMTWSSDHYAARGTVARDLNAGTAGIVLALAELFGAGAHETEPVLREAARWLEAAPAPRGAVAGLYVGEAGIAAALLRSGQVLRETRLVDAALERAGTVAQRPHGCQDLFSGTAGRLRVHLLLWDETGDSDQMAAARAAGEELVRSAERIHGDETQWTIPQGYGALSSTAYLGYAHGSAGIADTLLDLTEATGDDRFSKPATGVARRLRRLAVPALDDGSGLEWPSAEGGQPIGPMWCHGSTGIGRFLLHVAALDLMPDSLDLARRAGRNVAFGGRALGPVQCHGLAGSIEFLLDLHTATGAAGHLREALQLARLLDGFQVEKEGRLSWCSDRAEVVVPDYMVGFSGIAMCLLRLADPTRPHQLSRAGFRLRPRDDLRNEVVNQDARSTPKT